MLRNSLTAGVSAVAIMIAAPALAADMPAPDYSAPAPAPVVAPVVYDWTGVYMGVNAGYGWGDFSASDIDAAFDGGDVLFDSFGFDADGFLAGGQVGANWQMDQFVFGVEADIQWSDMDGSTSFINTLDLGEELGVAGELNWFGTVRGRLGVAFDRFLVYGTGGLAYGDVDVSADVIWDEIDFAASASTSDTRVGWTLGAGVEAAVTDNLSLKAEYLYVDLGDDSYNFTFTDDEVIATAAGDVDFDAHIVRAGLNYRFNMF